MENVGRSIGYQVRLNTRYDPVRTRILYCTAGILLKRLEQKDFLNAVSHIVLDEVHERQVETDFLMTLLKQQAVNFPHLRVVLMSATLQENLFVDYFRCPVVYVEGRMFPVQQHYLQEINQLVAVAQKEVAIARGKSVYSSSSSSSLYLNNQSFKKDARNGKNKGGGGLSGQIAALEINQSRPPRFDAEIVAETVIRIIQTYGKRNRDGNNCLTTPIASSSTSATTTPTTDNDIDDSGEAILVFLSGVHAIEKVSRALRQRNLHL